MKRFLKIAGGIVAILLLILGAVAWQYFINHNWRTVEEGAFYGSRQMSGPALAAAIRDHGIKTVVNFRGDNAGQPWYDDEVKACEAAGVTHVNFAWSKSSLPPPESLAAYIALIETGEKPFLTHCQGGTHRTGVAAACYELIRGKGVDAARAQFGPAFNDAPIGKLVDLYEGSTMPFAQWVREIYPLVYVELKASEEQAAPEATVAAGA
ncbi:MAG: tyrosine-protein phosphatase [Candidatus Hydrogenedentes bacterium]|nr:tyrosine-protein phosphatase [Candidatus Hydrogenedentota bacterium]